MQPDATPIRPEELLEHDAWIRRLARGLLADPARADDATQDAWLAALERPPAHRRDLRAWFARVTRRRALDAGRRDATRSERERLSAGAGTAGTSPAPSTAELAHLAELQRDVADALLGLAEPYRTTLLMRFFEDLPPRVIAARTGRPVDTVRTHLERGLAQLRARLDARYGDRGAWASGIVVLASRGGGGPVAGALVGLLAFVSGRWIAAAAVILAAGTWVAWRAGDPGLEPTPETTVAAQPSEVERAPTDEPLEDALALEPRASEDRVPAAAPRSPADPPSLPIVPSVEGVLVDADGRPLAGRTMLLVPGEVPRRDAAGRMRVGEELVTPEQWRRVLGRDPGWIERLAENAPYPALYAAALQGDFEVPSAVTDAQGRFTLHPDARFADAFAEAELELDDPELALVFFVPSPDRADGRRIAVAAPTVTIAGRIVDAAGAPVRGANLQVRHDLDRIAGFPYRTDSDHGASLHCFVEADGSFEAVLPRTSGTTVGASAGGFLRTDVELPRESRRDLVITLERNPPPEDVVRGIVLDADGGTVEGAQVALGYNQTRTDAGGRFELALRGPYDREDALHATSRTAGYAVLEGIGAQARERGRLHDVVVRLNGPTLPIAGVLVDAEGKPLSGVAVSTVEITPLAGITGGAEKANGATDKTGADGAFRLAGLDRRAYRLRFARVDPLLYLESEPVAAGTEDARVVVPVDWSRGALAGRVVDRFGRPIEHALVAIGMDQLTAPKGRSYLTAGEVHTDADGRFRLTRVPRSDVTIHVRGAGVAITNFDVEELSGEEVTLVAPREVRFRIELAAGDPADGFRLLDAAGEALAVAETRLHATIFHTTVPRRDKSFEPCTTTDAAETIVFVRGAEELRRAAFDAFACPPAGGTLVLRY